MATADPDVLSIERYAEISAHIAYFKGVPARQILDCLDVDEVAWKRAHATWQRTMAAEIQEEQAPHVQKMGLVFQDTRKRLVDERATVDSIRRARAPVVAPVDNDAGAATLGEPSVSVDCEAGAMREASLLALPKPAPAPPSYLVAAATGVSSERIGEQPSYTSVESPSRPEAPPEPELAHPPAMVVSATPQGTSPGRRKAPPKTTPIDLEAVNRPALPFSSPAPAPVQPPLIRGEGNRVKDPQRGEAGTTARRSDSGSDAPPPQLTLQQYASLCVELNFRPEHAVQTLARYGLSLETRAAIDATWKARLARDPALRDAFSKACSTYHAFLASRGA
jgi:hypothetical protein